MVILGQDYQNHDTHKVYAAWRAREIKSTPRGALACFEIQGRSYAGPGLAWSRVDDQIGYRRQEGGSVACDQIGRHR